MSYKIAYNTHNALLNNLEKKLTELLNAKSGRREIRIVKIEMPEAHYSDDMSEQKNAKIQGISYSSPVKGTFELLEDGKVIDKKSVKLFDLPNITRRGTYIVGGNEYHFPLQKRLIPGVYTTEKNDGTISAWLNSSKGRNMEIILREKGDFIISVEKASTINLLAFLTGMGVDPSELRRAWGEEVYNTNAAVAGAGNPLGALEKFYEKTHYVSDPEPAKKDIPGLRAWITDYFNNKSEFDGDNVKITLGEGHTKTSPKLMVDSTIRMLDVSRGNKPEDNKESLIHNSVHDLSDFMVERVGLREYASKVKRTLERNLKDPKKDTVSKIYQADLVQKPVDSTFTQISISKMPKQNNPMDTMASFSEITVMGEGGISDLHQVTRDVRALDPTHFAFIDPAHTPEGENIGTTLHLSSTAQKVGKDLVQMFVDLKTKKQIQLNPRQVYVSYVTFPEYWDFKAGKIKPDKADGLVRAMHMGELKRVKPQEVQYSLIDSTQLLGVNTMAVPFVSHNNGTRIMTAAKMQSQAKPLKYREAPLIQSLTHEGSEKSVEQIMAHNILAKSPADGIVKSVSPDKIVIKGDDGKEYPMSISNKFWMNENNYEHEEPVVKVGDKVKKGQLLSESNYTKDGTLALGTNLNTAYVSYKGLNHEDGVVISESGAHKLTSMHAYQHPVAFTDQDVIDKKKFTSHFPATFNQNQTENIDDNGVIKVGSLVVKGDPLVLKMRKVEEDTISRKLANVSRLLIQDFKDTSDVWDKETQGKIAEVHVRKKDILIVIETEEKAKIGDKLVGRFGNKGTITTIISDDEMPKDEKGQAMDILFDPTGVPGRMNLGQILETTASKISEKTGKPYMAKPFGGDHTNAIGAELDKLKLKDHNTLTDGDTKIEGVLAGKQYFLKLEHMVDKKLSARGAGVGYSYTMDGQPSKGSGTTGQAIGLGEMYALLAHGAQANLAEMYTFKSDKSLETWRAIENGTFMPPPEMPAASERFVSMLRGMGVDLVEDDKNVVKMTPFLDRDIRKISNGEIKDATVLRAKDLKEEKGGLYDFKTTGGLQGDKWSHIELAEPIPHPTFEFAILAVTRLKKQEFEDIMAGKLGVKSGKVVSADEPGAASGGEGIKALLGSIDVDSRLEEMKAEAQKAKGSDLNKLHREARVLKNFRDNKIDLREMVVSTIPVLPPKFRPIVEMTNGDINVADVNEHYRAAILMNNHLKEYKGRPGLRDEANKVRRDLFEGMRGVMGMSTGLVTKPDVKGIAEQIAGSSPKYGYFHSKLLKRRQETSGRGVVGPGPELDMDSLGIPENMAWNMFEPYVIKDLKAQGLTSMRAREEIDKRTPFARDALLRTMENRPVIMNRAPTLHKFSIMAFKPKLVPGSAIKVPIEVLGGLNMDFDGDQAGVHVPSSPEAVKEAWGMVASKNLYQSGTAREKLSPSLGREYMLGVFKLTRDGKTTSKMYENAEMALRDAVSKKIGWTDIISVKGLSGGRAERTTAGKIKINQTLPSSLRDYQATYNENYQKKILTEVGKLGGETFKKIIGDWKDAGRIFVYESGTSFLLSDLKALTKERRAFYAQADIEANRVRSDTKLSKEQKEAKIIEIYGKVDRQIKGMSMSLPDNRSGKSNNIADMVASGMSKPGPDQLKQLVGTVGLMMDHRQQIIPEPVRGNYAEGLDTAEFFQHMYSQRKGMIDKSRSVSGPGMLSKELTNSGTQQKITMIDCNTMNGVNIPPDKNLLDRMLAAPVAGIARNTAIDGQLLGKIQAAKIPMVKMRSVLTCEAANGVCAMCFGIDDNGNLPRIGANVGISEIQSVTERSVQLPMKAFHCNHPGTLVFVKKGDETVATTMEALWHDVAGAPHIKNGIEMKWAPDDWMIHDANGWAELIRVARHAPDDKIVQVKLKSSHTIVCQANHPLMLRRIESICGKCGESALSVEGSGRNQTYSVRCATCSSRQKISKEVWGQMLVRSVEAKDAALGMVAKVSLPPIGGDGWVGDINDAWLLGFFLAEGSFNIRAESEPKNDFPIVNGNVASGGHNCVALHISQLPGEIYDEASNRLNALGFDHKKYDTMMTIFDAKLARRLVMKTGQGAANKRLPQDFMMSATGTQMGDILSGWIDGDGCIVQSGEKNSTHISATSTSYAIVQSMFIMASHLGMKASVDMTTNKELTRNQAWCVRIIPTQEQAKEHLSASVKCRDIVFTSTNEEASPTLFDTGVAHVRDVFGELPFVYDVTTSTGTFCAGGVWNHNSGGVASADKGQGSAFDRALTVFRIPETVPGKATLSELSGRVEGIRPSGYGGFIVTIGGKEHKVSKGLEVTVKMGDMVEKGDKISTGMVKAQEMLKLKGLQATQGQIAQDLDDAFRSGGIKFNRRTYEVASRMLTEQVRISDPGDNQDFVPGDYTTIQKVDAWNKQNPGKKKIQYNTILPGTQMAPMMTDDWARRMSLSRIKGTIEEGAAMGFKSDRKQTVMTDLVLGPNTRIKRPGEKRIKL